MTDHILIIDDDQEILSLLADYLQRQGYQTSTLSSGIRLQQFLSENTVDLIVLDIMLPEQDGLEVCKNLRHYSTIPVIMLTARGEEMDRIIGLEIGADDYLAKPFNPRELVARIKVVLRRTRTIPPGDLKQETANKLTFASWLFDTDNNQLTAPNGVTTVLSIAEVRLLQLFLQNPQTALSRDRLLHKLKGRDASPYDRSIDMQISRLRQHFKDMDDSFDLIKTLRNEGYILNCPVTPLRKNSS